MIGTTTGRLNSYFFEDVVERGRVMNLERNSDYLLVQDFLNQIEILKKKRKEIELNSRNEEAFHERKRWRENVEMEKETEYFVALGNVEMSLLNAGKERKNRGRNRNRDRWWNDGYAIWDDCTFKKTFRIKRETFNLILREIDHELETEPTNMKPRPSTLECQLALTLYRLEP